MGNAIRMILGIGFVLAVIAGAFLLCRDLDKAVHVQQHTYISIGEVQKVEYLQGNFSAPQRTIVQTDKGTFIMKGLQSVMIGKRMKFQEWVIVQTPDVKLEKTVESE